MKRRSKILIMILIICMMFTIYPEASKMPAYVVNATANGANSGGSGTDTDSTTDVWYPSWGQGYRITIYKKDGSAMWGPVDWLVEGVASHVNPSTSYLSQRPNGHPCP